MKLKAILAKDVEFLSPIDGKPIFIAKDTELTVDPEESIAFYNHFHFMIFKDEYIIMN